jgi:anti-sigma-K factor RskA
VQLIPLVNIPVPEGRSLQVWTLQSREQGPIPVGLMNSPRTISLSTEKLPPTQPEQLFEISLEPAGGSPTGRPTGPVLMKGVTSETF